MSQILPYLRDNFSSILSRDDALSAQIDAALADQSILHVAYYERQEPNNITLSAMFAIPAAKSVGITLMAMEAAENEKLTVFGTQIPVEILQNVAEIDVKDMVRKRVLDMAG